MTDDLPERLRIPHPIDSRHDSRDPLCPCFTCKQRRQAADRIDELEAKITACGGWCSLEVSDD